MKACQITASACLIMLASSCSNHGKVLFKDHDTSDPVQLESTWNGDPDIARELSCLYQDMDDKARAFQWARLAGESCDGMLGVETWVECIKDSDSLPTELRTILYGGIANNEKEAIELILAQASHKYARASLLLGEYLHNGLMKKYMMINDDEEYEKVFTADQDYEKAIKWYEDAASRGMMPAWYWLSEIVAMRDTENNRSKSLYWIMMVCAMDQGRPEVAEEFAEGVREKLGEEIRKDIAKQVIQKIDMICDDKWNVLDIDGNRITEPIKDRVKAKERALEACGILR
jgi:TPR repeat protein